MGRHFLPLNKRKFYQEALAYRLEGFTYNEIGQRLNISRQRAQQIVRPPKPIYDLVCRRANFRCEQCGLKLRNGHVHHKGGNDLNFNHIGRLQYLCISCHKRLHLKPDSKVTHCRRCGIALRQGPHQHDYANKHCANCRKFQHCAICGTEFLRKSSAYKFCPSCRVVKQKCRECGKIIVRDRGQHRSYLRNNHAFCNKICQGRYLGKTYKVKAFVDRREKANG